VAAPPLIGITGGFAKRFRTINFGGFETFFGASRVLPFRPARHPAVVRASRATKPSAASALTIYRHTELQSLTRVHRRE
jgi:hypothetical protein